MDIFSDIKQTFREGSVLTRLIYVNLGVFLLVKIIALFFYLSASGFDPAVWLAMPSQFSELAVRPWTPITYMFLHTGFLHLLFNILGLYWFGKMFLYDFEGDKLLAVYLLGGLSGALVYLVSYNVFPVFDTTRGLLLGASASVFAILVAVSVYEPNRQIHLFFIGRFAMKYVALFYVVLSVISIAGLNPGGNLAHLGGAALGWLYIAQLRRGRDIGGRFVDTVNRIPAFFHRRKKMKVSFKQPPRDDYEYNRQKNIQQDEINRILDKIAKSGYDSLSKEEKETLFKQGKG